MTIRPFRPSPTPISHPSSTANGHAPGISDQEAEGVVRRARPMLLARARDTYPQLSEADAGMLLSRSLDAVRAQGFRGGPADVLTALWVQMQARAEGRTQDPPPPPPHPLGPAAGRDPGSPFVAAPEDGTRGAAPGPRTPLGAPPVAGASAPAAGASADGGEQEPSTWDGGLVQWPAGAGDGPGRPRSTLDDLIASLSADERRVLKVLVGEKRSVREAASVLSIPVAEVRRLERSQRDKVTTFALASKASTLCNPYAGPGPDADRQKAADATREHVTTCRRCRDDVEDLRLGLQMNAAGLLPAVAGVRAPTGPPGYPMRRRRPLRVPALALLAVLLAAGAAFAGVRLVGHHHAPAPTSGSAPAPPPAAPATPSARAPHHAAAHRPRPAHHRRHHHRAHRHRTPAVHRRAAPVAPVVAAPAPVVPAPAPAPVVPHRVAPRPAPAPAPKPAPKRRPSPSGNLTFDAVN